MRSCPEFVARTAPFLQRPTGSAPRSVQQQKYQYDRPWPSLPSTATLLSPVWTCSIRFMIENCGCKNHQRAAFINAGGGPDYTRLPGNRSQTAHVHSQTTHVHSHRREPNCFWSIKSCATLKIVIWFIISTICFSLVFSFTGATLIIFQGQICVNTGHCFVV